jgi:hypothetical protein
MFQGLSALAVRKDGRRTKLVEAVIVDKGESAGERTALVNEELSP